VASSISIKTGKQLAVFLRDEPGALTRVCEAFGKNGINIDALATESGGFFGQRDGETLVRMIVSDPDKAMQALGETGATGMQNEVLMIETANRPGGLAKISERLSQAGVNIESIYLSGTSNAKKSLIVLQPSNLEKAMRALQGK
jgi:hypothetical protein